MISKKAIWFYLVCGVLIVTAVITQNICPYTLHKGQKYLRPYMDFEQYLSNLLSYKIDHQAYPSNEEGLKKLVEHKYVAYLRPDPWGNPYVYQLSDESAVPVLYSFGPNGIDEAGKGDDIVSTSEYSCEKYNSCYTLCETIDVNAVLLAIVAGVLLILVLFVQLVNYLYGRFGGGRSDG